MQLWLILALIAPALWALVHVLDAYVVRDVFEAPWVGIVTSGFGILAALPVLSAALFFTGVKPIEWDVAALAGLAGAAYMVSQVLYFTALRTSEAGIVAAYWNMVPMALPIASFLMFGEVLTPLMYAGIVVIVSSSVGFCLLDGTHESRWRTFWLMALGAALQVAYFLLQKEVFESCPTYQGFLIITVSMAFVGLTPLLKKDRRRIWRSNWTRIRPAIGFLLFIEVINIAAVGTSQFAVQAGRPSLVSAVEATMPAYTFFLALLLFRWTKSMGDEAAGRRLPLKIVLSIVMGVGVWLVSGAS